jgi:hypothetical protein
VPARRTLCGCRLVEGSLSALARGHGMRVSRYIGQKKRNWQAILLTGWLVNDPNCDTRKAGH